MATKSCQPQAPTMTAAAERDGGGDSKAPPPRRGQIKEKIFKDVVAAVASMAASLVVRADKSGDGDK